MRTWKYSLEFEGRHLRKLIKGEETRENQAEIIRYLKTCCKILMKQMKEEEFWYSGLDELYFLLEDDNKLILSDEDINDYGFESRTKLINKRLT